MNDDFADIRARLGAATPGPWRASVGDVVAEQQWYDVDAVGRGHRYVAEVVHEGNADLIAHAPGDLRRLLDEVDALRRPPARLADDEAHLSDILRRPDDPVLALRAEVARLRAEYGEAAPAPWERAGHWGLWRRDYGDDAEIVVWRVREDEAWWCAIEDGSEVAEGSAPSVIEAIRAADAWLAGREGA